MSRPSRAGVAAVVLAGGSGSRLGADRNKVLLDLAGIPVLAHSLRTVAALDQVRRVVVVAREADLHEVSGLARRWAPGADVVVGGADRAASEQAAFAVLRDDVTDGRVALVAVHDGARPLAGPDLWHAVLDAAARHGGALPARPLGPVLAGEGADLPSGLHEDLAAVSTPQAFAARPLLAAYAAHAARTGAAGTGGVGFVVTDTSSCVERYAPGVRIATVPDPDTNLKVTWPGDLDRAERLLAGR